MKSFPRTFFMLPWSGSGRIDAVGTGVAQTTDESFGRNLSPGQTVTLGGRFNSVYEPAFEWEFEHNGKTYSTYTKYGDRSFLSQPVTPVGKSENLVPLSRAQ